MAKRLKAKPLWLRLYFTLEAPALGSGFRCVEAKVGRKWVYLTYPYPLGYPSKKAKVSVEVFDELLATSVRHALPSCPVRKRGKSRVRKPVGAIGSGL